MYHLNLKNEQSFIFSNFDWLLQLCWHWTGCWLRCFMVVMTCLARISLVPLSLRRPLQSSRLKKRKSKTLPENYIGFKKLVCCLLSLKISLKISKILLVRKGWVKCWSTFWNWQWFSFILSRLCSKNKMWDRVTVIERRVHEITKP